MMFSSHIDMICKNIALQDIFVKLLYLRSAMKYLLCIQHALCEYPKKSTRYASSSSLSPRCDHETTN